MNSVAPSQGDIRVTVFGCTDPGRTRTHNEDNFLVADLSRASAEGGYILQPDATPGQGVGRFDLGSRGAILAVADGMGGAAGGATASRLAVAWLYREMLEGWCTLDHPAPGELVHHLDRAVHGANRRILEEAGRDPALQGMGTTLTLAGVAGGQAHLLQVGDSRGYLVRNGSLVQLTRDQSVVQELVEAGTLTEEEAERSEYSNRILQALGVKAEISVPVICQSLYRNDRLLLCSDGLSRVLEKDRLARLAGRDGDLAESCRVLVEEANARGGPDNITVVMAHFGGTGLPPSPAGERATGGDADPDRSGPESGDTYTAP